MVLNDSYSGLVPNNGTLYISKLYLIVTRDDYKDMYNRPYAIKATRDTIDRFENLLNVNGINNEISDAAVAQYIPDAIDVSALPISRVDIPNGWNTVRLRFLMEVVYNFNGIEEVSYIQGYSDRFEQSYSGIIDPGLVLYINTITQVSRMTNPSTGLPFNTLRKTYNVIADSFGKTRYSEIDTGNNIPFILRPVDIMGNLYVGSMREAGTNVINSPGVMAGTPQTSSARNNNPISYFTRTLNGFTSSKVVSAGSMAPDIETIYRNAQSGAYTTEDFIINNPFIKKLYDLTGEIAPVSFNLGILKTIDPNVENVNRLINRTNEPVIQGAANILNSNDSEELSIPTIEVKKATIVANIINSLMIDNMLTTLTVSISNKNGIDPLVLITNINSFIDGVDLVNQCHRLTHSIKSILVPILTDSGQLLIDTHINTDILGDTTVGISVNLNPTILFRFPTFANSLYIPVIANEQVKDGVVNSFSSFMDSTFNLL